jgi:hypothetical protein
MGERTELTVEEAAVRLGISKWATHKAVNRGKLALLPGSGPARVTPAAVEDFRVRRQIARLELLAAKGVDLVQLATDTASLLRPPPGAPFACSWEDIPKKIGQNAVAAFGVRVLRAATLTGDSCRWCAAAWLSKKWGAAPPEYGPAVVKLLGPLRACDTAILNAEMERLSAYVNAGTRRPSQARTASPAARRPVTPPTAAPAPVQRPAAPAARPASTSTLRAALTAAGAVARPGMLRCGHLLAAECSCPRIASKAVTASAPAGQGHTGACGCGCQCTHGTLR